MLAEKAKARLARTSGTEPTRWVPKDPTERQAAFLERTELEALYGGAAGGGKTEALLMAALEYVDHPRYRAVLFRRSYPQLAGADSLIERSHAWLGGKAQWNATEKRWTFPSGARLYFSHLHDESAKYNHQGPAYHFVGFDELTQFPESVYRYLIGRVRRTVEDEELPLRVRAASNPGGIGHEWVKQRFLVEGASKGRAFVPAKLEDNPYLDRVEYVKGLMELHPLEREQLLRGDWDAVPSGGFFRREWFRFEDGTPGGLRWVRYWDLAATEAVPGRDPDYTAGAKVALGHDGCWYVADVRRVRLGPDGVERLVRATAAEDGPAVSIVMEQEPGSAGKALVSHYARSVLVGYDFRGVPSSGDKSTRAAPVASAAEQGNVVLVRGQWVTDFLDEATQFPMGAHDDQVDAVSGAFATIGYAYRTERVDTADHYGRRAIKSLRSAY